MQNIFDSIMKAFIPNKSISPNTAGLEERINRLEGRVTVLEDLKTNKVKTDKPGQEDNPDILGALGKENKPELPLVKTDPPKPSKPSEVKPLEASSEAPGALPEASGALGASSEAPGVPPGVPPTGPPEAPPTGPPEAPRGTLQEKQGGKKRRTRKAKKAYKKKTLNRKTRSSDIE